MREERAEAAGGRVRILRNRGCNKSLHYICEKAAVVRSFNIRNGIQRRRVVVGSVSAPLRSPFYEG